MTTRLRPAARPGIPEYRPEIELLFCCARTHVDDQRSARVQALLQEEIDWSYLTRTASLHKVLPLLYWNLNAICASDVPPAVLAQLREHFRANAQRNLLLTRELIRLLQLFDQHDILAVPYKGPVLATDVYGNLALRHFIDLDILIRKGDLHQAKHLLISQGYNPTYQWSQVQETAHIQSKYEYSFDHVTDGIRLELHWQLVQSSYHFPLELDSLQKHLKTVNLAGTRVLTFTPEDSLLILCVHGAKHGWDKLSMICDVAETIRAYSSLDWDAVLKRATATGSVHILLLGLNLAHSFLERNLPADILETTAGTPKILSLTTEVSNSLFRECDSIFEARVFFYLRTREHFLDRVRAALPYWRRRMIPNEKDQAFFPLPPALSFLHYVLRPIRLVREYGLRPLGYFLKRLFT